MSTLSNMTAINDCPGETIAQSQYPGPWHLVLSAFDDLAGMRPVGYFLLRGLEKCPYLSTLKPSMVVQTCNSSPWRLRQKDPKFKVS